MRLLRREQAIPEVRMINSYFDYAPMIQLYADNARKHDLAHFDHILFSFHGIPQRQLRKADRCNHCLTKPGCCETLTDANQFCYTAQCHATAFAIAAELGLPRDRYTICFQSRLGRDPWTQPYTSEVLKERRKAGDNNLLVFSPAFVADCLETIVEISTEYAEEWEEMGGQHIQLVESLNDHPQWISALAGLVRAELPRPAYT
jgi:ferrochelatase